MSQLQKRTFGTLPSHDEVFLYSFRNSSGIELSVTNFGGRIVTVTVPDRAGRFADVALGFDSLDGYVAKNPYFGALVGRYANRIFNGEFSLNGQTYRLPLNNGKTSLHGGIKGFDKVPWSPREVSGSSGPALELTYLSADGEEGYPGNLTTRVLYELTDAKELRIDYHAVTDKPTILNLTNHSYFDLAGQGSRNVLDHVVTLNADRFTPSDENQIPTGEVRNVEGTPFDFRRPTRIGERIDNDDEQLKLALGYDHNFILTKSDGELSLAARVVHPQSGRVLEVLTNQPAVQFYTGNHLEGNVKGKGGVAYPFRSGFCLETQHYPDTPHHPNFPSVELRPGEEFRSTTVFRFSVEA